MRTRRWWCVCAAALLAVAATGCITPPGYSPPVIASVQVAPSPARPGDTVVLTLDVRDDQGVTGGVTQLIFAPGGVGLNGIGVCSVDVAPSAEDPTDATVTVACPVPMYASNGTWSVQLRLNDGPPQANLPGITTRLDFDVAGGTDDVSPPQLVSSRTSPSVVNPSTTFTLTTRVSDQAPVEPGRIGGAPIFNLAKPFTLGSAFFCRDAAVTPVSTTESDISWRCEPDFRDTVRSVVGVHSGRMPVRDALGHQTDLLISIDVLPA